MKNINIKKSLDSVYNLIEYHTKVTAGAGVLRFNRIRDIFKLRTRTHNQTNNLAPLLRSTPRFKELASAHYLKGRYIEKTGKVAWITSGGPVEILKALGFYVFYPENHGAVCGVQRKAVDICGEAESAGYSPDICSYARTDIGSLLSGNTPVGRIPRPDLLLCCTNICQTVLSWYRVIAHELSVPLILIDTPFIYGSLEEHSVTYVQRQLGAAIEEAEKISGRQLSFKKLQKVTRLSKDLVELWSQIIACGKARPAPLSAFDQFIHLAPVVEMRGEAEAVDYYHSLLRELQDRIRDGVGAVTGEQHRLLWDNLPIWFWLRKLSIALAQKSRTALVASTYTNAWGELAPLIDEQQPIASAAKVYLNPILNHGTAYKLNTMKKMVKDYQLDGALLHSDRSCKPYSIGQMDQRVRLQEEVGIPAFLIEADHNDSRVFAQEQILTRLDAFLELL